MKLIINYYLYPSHYQKIIITNVTYFLMKFDIKCRNYIPINGGANSSFQQLYLIDYDHTTNVKIKILKDISLKYIKLIHHHIHCYTSESNIYECELSYTSSFMRINLD